MDDINAGSQLGPRVLAVTPMDDYKLFLTFTNGERRIFDAGPLLKLTAFKPLANKNFFQLVKVAYGTLLWPRDIDYCPDTLYNESVPETSVQERRTHSQLKQFDALRHAL